MAKHVLRIPHAVVRPAFERGERRHSGMRAATERVTDRLLDGELDNVHATAMLPDGSVQVWGEAGASRPPVVLRKYEEGWERIFGDHD